MSGFEKEIRRGLLVLVSTLPVILFVLYESFILNLGEYYSSRGEPEAWFFLFFLIPLPALVLDFLIDWIASLWKDWAQNG